MPSSASDAKEVIAEDFDQAMTRLTPNELPTCHRYRTSRHMRVLRWAVQIARDTSA